jgi:hypothetical protein
MESENKYSEKHLEFIQNVINRMARNSFLLKGWSITLLLAVVALITKGGTNLFSLFAPVSVFLFWGLDAYYLRQEKLYRLLFDAVRNGSDKGGPFNLDANGHSEDGPSWIRVAFSKTLFAFHGVVASIACTISVIAVTNIADCFLNKS